MPEIQAMTRTMGLIATLLACAGGVASGAAIAPLRWQPLEIATSDAPGQASVTVDPREGFVVTWQERDANGTALLYAVLSPEGRERRRGRIAAGANWFVNWADFPSLVVLDNGDWVTHWLERAADSAHAYDIRLVRSRDRGRSWDAPITPHVDGTPTQHGFVSLVPAGGDRVIVVWLDGRRGASGGDEHDAAAHEEHEDLMTLRSVVLDRSGARSEEGELDDSTCSCCQTDAARIDGRTVVAYRDRSAEEVRDIAVLSRSASEQWSAPRRLHEDGWRIEGCPVNGPAVAVNDRQLLVFWPTAPSGEFEARYTIRQGDRDGAMTVLAPGTRMRGRLDAAAWQRGFLLSWIGSGTGFTGLMLAQLDAQGRVIAQSNVADVPLGRISGNPRLAARNKRALLVWVEPEGDGRKARLAAALLRP